MVVMATWWRKAMWESYNNKKKNGWCCADWDLIGQTDFGVSVLPVRYLSFWFPPEGREPLLCREETWGCTLVVGVYGNGQRSTGTGRSSSEGVWGGALIEGSFEIPPAVGDQPAHAWLQWRHGWHRKPTHSTEVPCDSEELQQSELQSPVMQMTCLGGGAEDGVWLPETVNVTRRKGV